MLLLDDLRALFSQKTNLISFLKSYASKSHSLMYYDDSFIHEVVTYLRSSINTYYNRNTQLNSDRIVDKYSITQNESWINNNIPHFINKTSGSTDTPFEYRIWKEVYNDLEGDSHYLAIANEFGITAPCKILNIFSEDVNRNTLELVKIGHTFNPVLSHGLRHGAEVHTAILNKTFFKNYYRYYEEIIDYIINNNFDIINTTANHVASLSWNLNRLGVKNRVCKLLSNTGSKLDLKHVKNLVKNGNIENWCDHMRCWDGGATFITCKFNQYHLMDGMSWVYSDNYKLISDDYFSLPNPFVRYWNGDYIDVHDEYKRCQCGRAYRQFTLGRTRSRLSEIAESPRILKLLTDNGLTENIIRIDVFKGFMRIFTKRLIPIEQKDQIKMLINATELQFTVESQ